MSRRTEQSAGHVTFLVGGDEARLPGADAAVLAEELRRYAAGFRGPVEDPRAALSLAEEIDRGRASRAGVPITVSDVAAIDALHRVLNAIVHELGPAMKLYGAVDAAKRVA